MRQDPEWKGKVLVGSLLFLSAMIVPVIGQVALLGWSALITRQAIARRGEGPLPRLDFDFGWLGKLVGIGFKPFLVNFLWRMPVAFLIGGLVGCMYVAVVVAAVSASHQTHGGAGGGPPTLIFAVFGIMMLVLVPLSILAAAPAQAAMLRAEVTDDMNAGLKLREVLRMTRLVLKELIIGNLLIGLVAIPLVFVGMLACYVGIFPVAVVLQIVHAHFMAQVYELYLERGGEPLKAAPDPETASIAAPPPPPPPAPSAAGGW
jgi:hypothetical protein